MPVEYANSDIFQVEAEALVNSVNCVGVMGRGIALQFKERYPDNFRQYKAACDRGELEPGRMFVTEMGKADGPRYIINFPTKRHWRGRSRIEDLVAGLDALVATIRERDIKSIALPALASDLGGLKWADVRKRIEAALSSLDDVHVLVMEPGSGPADGRSLRLSDPPKMTLGRATLLHLIQRYLKGFLDPFITLLEVHKLMYLAQEAGEPLRLNYGKAPYGPYAQNLQHVLNRMNNHYILRPRKSRESPREEVRLLPGALAEATQFLQESEATLARIRRVTKLIDGFETPEGLELLATVHWVATREEADTPKKAIEATYAWNDRKRQFSERQIQLAFDTLSEQGWISTSPDTSA